MTLPTPPTDDRKLNLLGLFASLLIAALTTALVAYSDTPTGGAFNTPVFVKSFVAAAVPVLTAFFAHAHVPLWGNQGLPGTSMVPPPAVPPTP